MKFFGFCVASVHGLALNSTVIEDVGAMANSQVLVMSKNPPFSISWPFGATEPIIATYENFNYNGFYVKQVCSATLNGRTYLFGGGTSIEDPQRQQVARVRGDMTGLDILSAQLPYPMVEHSCSTVRNKWIMLCGTADTVSGEFSHQCNAFAEDGNNFLWKREPDTNGAHAKSAMVYSSRGYSVIIGGVDGYDSTVVETIQMRQQYSDPQSGAWIQGKALPAPIEEHSAVAFDNGRICVFGGWNDNNFGATKVTYCIREPWILGSSGDNWGRRDELLVARRQHRTILLTSGGHDELFHIGDSGHKAIEKWSGPNEFFDRWTTKATYGDFYGLQVPEAFII